MDCLEHDQRMREQDRHQQKELFWSLLPSGEPVAQTAVSVDTRLCYHVLQLMDNLGLVLVISHSMYSWNGSVYGQMYAVHATLMPCGTRRPGALMCSSIISEMALIVAVSPVVGSWAACMVLKVYLYYCIIKCFFTIVVWILGETRKRLEPLSKGLVGCSKSHKSSNKLVCVLNTKWHHISCASPPAVHGCCMQSIPYFPCSPGPIPSHQRCAFWLPLLDLQNSSLLSPFPVRALLSSQMLCSAQHTPNNINGIGHAGIQTDL